MGDIDHGGIDALVKGFDLRAQLHPQLGVKVRQRLIEQENLGVSDHGPAHRHPLALAAGALADSEPAVYQSPAGWRPAALCFSVTAYPPF
jgi:hypothetical protein